MRKAGFRIPIFFLLLFAIACHPTYNLAEGKSEGKTTEVKGGENANLSGMIAPYKEKMEAEMNTVIGSAAEAMEVGIPQGTLGNWCSDVLLEWTKNEFDPEVDFCLLNNGGLRNPLPAGNITMGNMHELMPFDNEAVVISLSGNQIDSLLDYMVNLIRTKYEVRSAFPMAGISVSIPKTGSWSAEINGHPIESAKIYKLVTSDYLASGGDNLSILKQGKDLKLSGKWLRDIWADEIRSSEKPIQSQIDNRLIMIF